MPVPSSTAKKKKKEKRKKKKEKKRKERGVIRNPRTARLPVGIRVELVTPQLELRSHRRLGGAAFTESSRKVQIGSNLTSFSLGQDRF